MLVGTVATTYSGWFIAPSLAIALSKKTSGVQARTATATAADVPAVVAQPQRKTKSQRKARA
jgi:hypothetical protein